MAVFVLFIAAIVALLGRALVPFFLGNPWVNGIIVAVLIAGVAYIFQQVALLNREVAWMEKFRRNQGGSITTQDLPRLLSPMATMLGAGRGGRLSLSAGSLRTLLDGISSRLDETRETSRYLIGVLVFLGLLGTFYGLLETVQSVKGVLGGLSVGGDPAAAFADLKARLETPLGGMSTAFSASLFGLSGSLVLGFLDLQAGLAQNRFYNELEEILSGYTRLSGGGPNVESGDASVPAYTQALLEQTADSLDNLQRILTRGEESRMAANAPLLSLAERLGTLTDQMRTEQTLMLRLAEQQVELRPVLQRLADSIAQSHAGDESRGHLRNIEIHLARMSD